MIASVFKESQRIRISLFNRFFHLLFCQYSCVWARTGIPNLKIKNVLHTSVLAPPTNISIGSDTGYIYVYMIEEDILYIFSKQVELHS